MIKNDISKAVVLVVMFGLWTITTDMHADASMTRDHVTSAQNTLTEEQYAQSRTNYFAPPETVEPNTTFDKTALRFKSEVELVSVLTELNIAVDGCVLQRKTLESRIGTRPGSYSIHTHWITKYQNCLLQRRAEMDEFAKILQASYAATIEGGGENGATTLTSLIDRLRSGQSRSARRLDQEIRQQKKFIEYYNTGVKGY